MTQSMNSRQLATVLAALRLWRQRLENMTASSRSRFARDLASDYFTDDEPLTVDEIGELSRQLRTQPTGKATMDKSKRAEYDAAWRAFQSAYAQLVGVEGIEPGEQPACDLFILSDSGSVSRHTSVWTATGIRLNALEGVEIDADVIAWLKTMPVPGSCLRNQSRWLVATTATLVLIDDTPNKTTAKVPVAIPIPDAQDDDDTAPDFDDTPESEPPPKKHRRKKNDLFGDRDLPNLKE